MTAALRSPELPDAARPQWPVWTAPVALVTVLGAVAVAGAALLPIVLVGFASDTLAALALLALLLVQDSAFVGAALIFANITRTPRPWHFGARATPFWPTIGITALAFALMLGFEVGWIELLGIDEGNLEELEEPSVLGAIAVALAVIVLAPISEEIFFRAFFYRALRTRLRVWSASLIDGLVFGSLHFQGVDRDALLVLPVIAVFGVGQCLLYERTGSLFAVIATHAAFNTVASLTIAPVPAIVVGSLMLLACLLVPTRLGRWPSPVPS